MLKSVLPCTQLTIEKKSNGKLAFLNVLMTRRDNGLLRQHIYQKPTHTDCCLHKDLNNYPAQRGGIVKTIANSATLAEQNTF